MLNGMITRKNGVEPKLKKIGTLTKTGKWVSSPFTVTFDVKSNYSKYDKLTSDDFIISFDYIATSAATRILLNSKSYDALTGVLTIQLGDWRSQGSDFSIPIFILDRFNVGGVTSKLRSLLVNAFGKKVLTC